MPQHKPVKEGRNGATARFTTGGLHPARLFRQAIPVLVALGTLACAREQFPAKPPAHTPPPGQARIPPSGTAAYPPELQPTFADLAYANASSAQILDLFVPEGEGPFPLVINIHGGAFRGGSKEMLNPAIARALLDAGIAVASLNYRLSGEARFPAAVNDVKAAVRYLRANAPRFRIDSQRFLAFGQSAGGTLASMLGTSAQASEFDDPAFGNVEQPSSVAGVIDWFGPTDFLRMDAQARQQDCDEKSQTHGRAGSPESDYLGCEPATCPELAARANPITYITPQAPPFLLQKGARDCVVPVGQSTLLYEKLKAAHVPVTFDLLPNAGHGVRGEGAAFVAPDNIRRILDFVRATLKSPPTH